MELDDFKKVSGRYVAGIQDNGEKRKERLGPVIGLFRADQEKRRKHAIYWATILVILSLFYFSRFVSENDLFSVGMMIVGTGLVMGAIYTWTLARPIPDSTYTLPPVQFLSIAEKGMRFISAGDLFKMIPILTILGVGGGMAFTGRLLLYTDNLILLLVIWITFFTGLCLFGFRASRRNWEKENGELYRMIRDAKNSFEGSEQAV